jgi:hypothetical protein
LGSNGAIVAAPELAVPSVAGAFSGKLALLRRVKCAVYPRYAGELAARWYLHAALLVQ